MIVIAAPRLPWKYPFHFDFTCSVGSLLTGEVRYVQGNSILIALLALLFLTMCDDYWSDGRYTAAAIVMTKQIGRAYGV